MAYILGEREFWSLPLRVSPAVLVPRPESETVVEAALESIADRAAPLRILDLGTGSGCLLLALLSELPHASGLGIDRSAAALGSPGPTPSGSDWPIAPRFARATGAMASPVPSMSS